jgi:hypothetical protein
MNLQFAGGFVVGSLFVPCCEIAAGDGRSHSLSGALVMALPKEPVAELVSQECVSLLCLQETKLHIISDDLVSGMLGSGFDYAYVPAVGTGGGILAASRTTVWSGSHVQLAQHSLSIKLSHHVAQTLWWLTMCMDPE